MQAPRFTRRTWIIGSTLAVVLVAAIIVAAVPVTRTAVVQAACDFTGIGCAAAPGIPEGERLELDPVEAAEWGNYAALGDSYSSGDGAEDYASDTSEDEACFRSANAYPHLLAGRYAFAGGLTFAACSGVWGYGLVEEQDSRGEEQLERLTEHTSLVTIGIGGNDMRFTTVLRNCMVRLPVLDRGACTGQRADIEERRDEFLDSTFPELVEEIRDRSPDARLLVLGYPRIFPEDPSGLYYTLNASDQDWLNSMIDTFNSELRVAADEADAELEDQGAAGSVEYVDVAGAMAGHEVGTDSPWMHGVRLERGGADAITVDRASFHPTAQGQDALASHVADQVAEGPGRPLYATRTVVESRGD